MIRFFARLSVQICEGLVWAALILGATGAVTGFLSGQTLVAVVAAVWGIAFAFGFALSGFALFALLRIIELLEGILAQQRKIADAARGSTSAGRPSQLPSAVEIDARQKVRNDRAANDWLDSL